MPTRNILVVAVDGLRASALGAYGNTMFSTPAFDELAAESFLLDRCFAPTSDLEDIYGALWQSAHPARGPLQLAGRQSLAHLFARRGYATTLLTDTPELRAFGGAADFGQCVELADPLLARTATRPEHITETAFARFFSAASDPIASVSPPPPQLVWLHLRGLYGPWDAPLDAQRSLLDEGDPPPVEALAPPDFMANESDDPDASFRYGCAYAAQVMLLDSCLGGFLAALEPSGAACQWLVMLLGVRGFPLGEHHRIGGVDPRLFADQLHVPWLIRFPDGRGRLARSAQLASPLDVLPTLLEWSEEDALLKSSEGAREFGPTAPGSAGGLVGDRLVAACEHPAEPGVTEPNQCRDTPTLPQSDGRSVLPLIRSPRPAWRDAVISVNAAGYRAIRTDEWCLRQDPNASDLGELYVRPDDRWEANDVAKLCGDDAERLAAALERFCQDLGT